MYKNKTKTPEEISSSLPIGITLWLLSADYKTGILENTQSRDLIVDCLILNLIEKCANSDVWKLNATGWSVWEVLLRQSGN